jgi:4-oxalocrotonate tautomerase
MPRIRVEWLEGRTQQQRQLLAEAITRSVAEIARVRPEQVTVVFEEIPRHLQAKGGVFWSDKDHGA